MANVDALTREISGQGLHEISQEARALEERVPPRIEHRPKLERSAQAKARNQLLHLATYAQTRTAQVLRQGLQAIVARDSIELQVATFASRLRTDEQRIASLLGRQVCGLQVLELGAGQQCERARYFGQLNCVTAVDLDWIPRGGGVTDYLLMLRRNGIARLVKTAGRKMLLVDRTRRNAWARAVGTGQWFRDPIKMHADVCVDPLPREAFDLITSWSLFEHLSDPAAALSNAWQALRPGGALYIGIHLYTATNGHHDFRYGATGHGLPPWAHLRASKRKVVRPSAYLNEWRLDRWRRLFAGYPGVGEYLEDYGQSEKVKDLLTPDLRAELAPYSLEELVTVDAFYACKKPPNS